MSSLGLSLLILIVVAIGALAGYNFWLTRKPGARADDLDTGFSAGSSTRQEPSFSAGAAEPYLQVDSQTVESAPGDAERPIHHPRAQDPVDAAPARLPEWAEAPVPPRAPASSETPDMHATNAAPDQSDAQPAAAQWAPGVLPEEPAASPAPNLTWQPESAPSPVGPEPASQTSFKGSIEQAMRLQREADDLIDSGQQDGPSVQPGAASAPDSNSVPNSGGFDEAVDDSGSAQGLDDQRLNQSSPGNESEPAGRHDAPVDQPTDEHNRVGADQHAERSLFDTRSPDVDSLASAPGQSIEQEQTGSDTTAAPMAAAAQPEGPAPGWSGIDADRQAANFVATVNIELNDPVAGSELLKLTSQLTHAGTKPVRVTAGNPPAVGKTLIRTEPIQSDRDYTLLRLEVLQVNRHGPLSDVEYSGFVTAADAIGESLGVLVNPPDMNVVLIRSRVLDAEVASLDAQVAVNVETEEPIASAQFVELANKTGLTPLTSSSSTESGDDPAVFVARDNDGYVIYSAELKSAENPNRIVLMLDVPSVPKELQPVRKMIEGAWAFAQALNGHMIDDNGRFIDNALFERIESQIETHYQALLAAGVPAGSDLARQVYNPV